MSTDVVSSLTIIAAHGFIDVVTIGTQVLQNTSIPNRNMYKSLVTAS